MPAVHARRPSGQEHQPARHLDAQTSPAKHRRTYTAPETPTLLRLPSTTSSAGTSVSPRSRRATNPSTPALTPTQVSASSTTSPSYFSPQPAASGKEVRSPAARRPPASFSGHGIDTSRGPPITLITRGNSDIARRTSQQPSDFAFAQQQLSQLGLVSPGGSRSSRGHRQRRDDSEDSGEFSHHTQLNTSTLSRQNSTRSSRRQRHMASSVEYSSEYDSGMRSQSEDMHAVNSRHGATDTSGTDGGHGEDLFLNVAADSAAKEASADTAVRSDRLRSRIARASNRQSFPSAIKSSPAQSNSATPNGSRIPAVIDTKAGTQYHRSSLLPSRSMREQSPLTPSNPIETPRSRLQEISPNPSFSSRARDSDLSPRDFLAQLDLGRRRPSYPDAAHTPPNRATTFRPSNLHYHSSSRDNPRTPQIETPQEAASRADGTESHGSTGPATSVWDELDELKSRIRRIELGGKIPATSGAVVSQATADRPRTANTSVTTVSSSPNQQRKPNPSPDSTVGAATPSKVHPLLGEALVKAKQNLSPNVYRVLEATASEALALAELTGSAGPQGTLHSASSILNGASMPDRQVRRKADNICRSLTELCIALCDTKNSVASPALRRAAAAPSRRPSVQINGESPIRQSIEPESNELRRSSPSRALSRIEARRVSMLAGGSTAYGSPRETSQEPPTPSQSQIPSRINRAGTSLYRSRRTVEDEDEDPTLRAPSRALTDFRDTRSTQKTRFSREYTSREPMPDLQPSPALQPTTSLRHPTVSGTGNENHLLFRDGSRRYGLDHQNSPAYEKHVQIEPAPRTQFSSNRNSIGGISGLGRSGSLSRRFRGTSAGE